MNALAVPGFVADASAYRSPNRYATLNAGADIRAVDTVSLAYHPTPAQMVRCSDCYDSALRDWAICAAATVILGPLSALCWAEFYRRVGWCSQTACCPNRCRLDPDMFNGAGCCDANETCVDAGDPNSRNGCCPATQAVCGGRCCAPGDICCGEICCTPERCCNGQCCVGNEMCIDGRYCGYPPFAPPPQPKSKSTEPWSPSKEFDPEMFCLSGIACNGKCCPPFTQCCNDGSCRRICIR